MQSIERDLRLTRIGLKDAVVLLDLGGTLYEVRQDSLSAIYKDGDIIYRKLSNGRRVSVHRRMIPRLRLFVLSVDDNKEGLRVVNTEKDLLETKIDRLGEEVSQLYKDKENLSMQVTGVSEEARMWREKYESLKRGSGTL